MQLIQFIPTSEIIIVEGDDVEFIEEEPTKLQSTWSTKKQRRNHHAKTTKAKSRLKSEFCCLCIQLHSDVCLIRLL